MYVQLSFCVYGDIYTYIYIRSYLFLADHIYISFLRINPFVPNATFLDSLIFSGGRERVHWNEQVKINLYPIKIARFQRHAGHIAQLVLSFISLAVKNVKQSSHVLRIAASKIVIHNKGKYLRWSFTFRKNVAFKFLYRHFLYR